MGCRMEELYRSRRMLSYVIPKISSPRNPLKWPITCDRERSYTLLLILKPAFFQRSPLPPFLIYMRCRGTSVLHIRMEIFSYSLGVKTQRRRHFPNGY